MGINPKSATGLRRIIGAIRGARRSPHIDLFCDYDGVLTPIVARPKDATLDGHMRGLLKKFTACSGCNLAIVSGRMLEDVRRRVGLRNVTYCGNHGLHIAGPGVGRNQAIPVRARRAAQALKKDLQKKLHGIRGAILEDKGDVIAVHYRLVKNQDLTLLFGAFADAIKREGKSCLRVTKGKEVAEARPKVRWGKGDAVLWLLRARHGATWRKNTVAVYIGDDETDEDAFLALRGKGVTIRVGRGGRRTAARYTLKNTEDVERLLARLVHTWPA